MLGMEHKVRTQTSLWCTDVCTQAAGAQERGRSSQPRQCSSALSDTASRCREVQAGRRGHRGSCCQSSWQKRSCYRWQLPAGNEQQKQRNPRQKLQTERGKKKTLNISYVLVSSFQLKENLLSNDQRNSTAKADGEHPCGAIRAGWGVPSIKNYCMAC